MIDYKVLTTSQRYRPQVDFWQSRFADHDIEVHPQPAGGAGWARQALQVALNDASLRVIDQLADDAIGRFTVLTAALALVTARYFNTKRAIFRTPLLADADDAPLNPEREVPLVVAVDAGATLRELLHVVAGVVEQSYAFQNFPVGALLRDEWGADLATLTGFSLSCALVHQEALRAPAPIHFNCDRLEERRIVVEWAGDAIAPELIWGLAPMISGAVACFGQPGLAARDVERVPEEQRESLLVRWNGTTETRSAACAHDLFERQVARTPDAPALMVGDRTITYDQLNRSANRIARHLLESSAAGRGSIVGIWMNRSPAMIAAVFGALKAGLAYVPIDADWPVARAACILEDSGAAALLIDSARRPDARALDRNLVDADALLCESARPDGNPGLEVRPGDLAYIIYTSGSTGQPKGCAIEHRSLSNYLQWAIDFYWEDDESGTMGFFSPLSFDLTITSLFCPLLRGRSLVLCPQAATIEDILQDQFAAGSPVDTVKLTPSHVRVLDTLRIRSTNIRSVIVGGEALTRSHVDILKRIDPRIRVFNEYGPTEATVGCVVKEVAAGEAITIGRPIANARAYVLDEDQALVPVGVRGEICLSGDVLAREYHGRQALTAARFVPHPYMPGERLYRTGDIGRWLFSGELECLDRLDDQVKIRGYRVELGEVAAALRACDGVGEAIVVVDRHEDAPELVAYVTAADRPEPPVLPRRPMTIGLRRQLSGRLPDYMIPSAFIEIDSLPLTPNGKIDRQRLPPRTAVSPPAFAHTSPRGHEEQTLIRIWQAVFRVDRIGVDDDFFELGGHSLRAMQIVMRIQQELHVEVSLNDIFKSATVAALAAVIRQAAPSALEPIRPLPPADHHAVSHGQKRLWVLNQLEENAAAYNVSSAFELVGDLDVPSLERAFRRLIERHESLRTTFDVVDDEPRQRIRPHIDFRLGAIDVAAGPDPEQRARQVARADALGSFDLTDGPLVRATLARLGPLRFVLVLTMHHIVTDEWSFGVLIEDLLELYRREQLDVFEPLAPLPIQYKDFAAWQRALLAGEAAERHRTYWLDRLTGPLPPLDLPADLPRPDVKSNAGSRYRFSLDSRTAAALKSLGAAHGASLFITLVATVKVLLHRYTGQEEIRVGVPIAGRRQIELANQVGFYLNTLVLRDRLRADTTFERLLDAVTETATSAYEHDLFPFDRLVEELDTARDLGRLRLFDVLVAQGNAAPLSLELSNLEVYGFDTPVDVSKFDLAFQFEEDADGIVAELQYDTDLFLPDRMRRLRGHFETLVASILAAPAAPLGALDILPASERALLDSFGAARQRSVRDANGQLTPIGIPGDVWVPGDGEARDRTGTRGRWLADGTLEHVVSAGTPGRTAAAALEAGERAFIAPTTDAEMTLAAIWSAALGIDSVGVRDNFFELGGDSIIALQIVSRANRAGVHLSLKQLFRHPTIAELTQLAATPRAAAPGSDAGATGPLPLTPIERWFFDLGWPAPSHFGQAVLLEVPADVEPDLVSRAVADVWEHHDALRLRVARSTVGWEQTIAPGGRGAALFAVEPLPDAAALTARCDDIQRTLSIADGPLARVVLFQTNGLRPGRLLIAVHHFAIDALSWRILLEDLMSAYDHLRRGERVALPPKTMSFREWAHRLRAWSDSAAILADAAYWVRTTGGDATPFPADFAGDGSENIVGSEDHVSIQLDEAATAALLKQVPRAFNTQINDALLAALAMSCARATGRRALRVDLEGHGREDQSGDADVSRTVGWFTSLFPVTLTLPSDPDPVETLKAVKETLRAVPSGGLSYGLLRYLSTDRTIHAMMKALAAAPIRFNYLGQADQTFQGEGWRPAAEATGASQDPAGRRAYLLDVVAMVSDGRLELDWIFSRACHRRETIAALAAACRDALIALIEGCTAPGAGGFTPSDFPGATIAPRDLDRLVRRVGADRHVRRHVADLYDLTPMQQGLLFHSVLAEQSGVYVEQSIFSLVGDLDAGELERAWRCACQRHAVLRTAFFWQEVAQPVQLVFAGVEIPWDTLDWRGMPDAERDAMLRRFLETDRRRGLDLAAAPVMRCTLIRLDADRHTLCWTSHHILMDGWSRAIVLQDVMAAYQPALANRDEARAAERPFRSYVEWLQRQDAHQAELYWRTRLEGFSRPTPLPTAAPDEEDEPFAQQQLTLDADFTRELTLFGRRHRLTMNTIVSSAWALVLGGHSQQLDVVCGATLAGRPPSLDGAEAMVGLFINTLPMRFRLDPEAQLLSWLHDIQVDQAELEQYAYSSLVDVHRSSDVPRGLPLFESIVVFENYPVERAFDAGASRLGIAGVTVFEQTNYPLTFVIVPGDELVLRLSYDGSRCDALQARTVLQQIHALLAAFVHDPHQRIDALLSLAGVAGSPPMPEAVSAPPPFSAQRRFSFDADLTARMRALATRHAVPDLDVVRALAAALHYRYSAHEELLCTLGSAPLARETVRDHDTLDSLVPRAAGAASVSGQGDADGATARPDLGFAFADEAGRIRVDIHCGTKRFGEEALGRVQHHFCELASSALAAPAEPIACLNLLPIGERTQLIEGFNRTAKDWGHDKTIVEMFEEQAAHHPDRPAVSVPALGRDDAARQETWSYAELDARANRLAHYLIRHHGVGPDVLVGVMAERTFEMVLALMAVLKANGAYVPLDPEYPRDRLAFMLEDSGATVLLTQEVFRSMSSTFNGTVLFVDSDWPTIAREPDDRPPRRVEGNSLAYMIYTSGSTGRPKGAMNTHRGIANRLLWMQEAFGLTEDDRVLQKTPFSFDVSVWEFFWPLMTGAQLVMAMPGGHRDSRYLVDLIEAAAITTLHFVPSMLHAFLDEPDVSRCRRLKRVICSGEAISPELLRRFESRLDVPLFNLYGPTEAAVDVTAWRCDSSDVRSVVPIGMPIANTEIYILDEWLQPVPIGFAGELFIGGVNVGRGYLNRPDLTALKFIPDPFATRPGARLYRTGDLSRYRPDGNIEFLGRLDHQVKVRGFRIELGEIEAALQAHHAVREAVVIVREDRPDMKRLVAYVVAKAGEPLRPADLRASLRDTLPDYMVPSVVVPLAELPRLPNGKLDRRSLPAPEAPRDRRVDRSAHGLAQPSAMRPATPRASAPARPIVPQARHTTSGGAVVERGVDRYMPPRDDIERTLTRLWQDVLGVEPIGVTDDYFELGGHSLLSLKLMSRIQLEFGRNIPLAQLFAHPTIERLAAVLRRDTDAQDWRPLVSIRSGGTQPPLFLLPGAGGNLIYFYRLAHELAPQRPVYGLQAIGLDGITPPLTRVADIAALNIEEVRRVQPAGPYFLAGHSFGGKVALEMSQQLRQQGEEIGLLAILDTAAPIVEPAAVGADWAEAHWLAKIAREIEEFFGVTLDVTVEGLLPLPPDDQLARLVDSMRAAGWWAPSADQSLLRGYVRVYKANSQAAYVRRQPIARVPIALIKTLEAGANGDNTPPAILTLMEQPGWGWERFASSGVRVREVPGDHLSMLAEPNVRVLAQAIDDLLGAATVQRMPGAWEPG